MRYWNSRLPAIVAALALSGCMSNANYNPVLRRATASATYCPDSKLEIVDYDILRGRRWTALCGETMYQCTSDDPTGARASCAEKGD